MRITPHFVLPLAEIQAYCRTLPVQRLAIFGSALRDDFTPDSDIDMLVVYEAGAGVTYLDMAQQEMELAALIGRRVDLRTPAELSRYFRDDVMRDAVTIYERE